MFGHDHRWRSLAALTSQDTPPPGHHYHTPQNLRPCHSTGWHPEENTRVKGTIHVHPTWSLGMMCRAGRREGMSRSTCRIRRHNNIRPCSGKGYVGFKRNRHHTRLGIYTSTGCSGTPFCLEFGSTIWFKSRGFGSIVCKIFERAGSALA
ncbi:hypothetical protein N658DRAFT_78087 [Parathielavia hyrcaniae]|uniref:Uncharacterized protein n=1 Tax=Parathielavia hyrcaniae TaxID=113614 RepID=A0AAN6Q4X2_9PEZI|nr:hypothetical protein N658DRAFT_78087 [Parathielavia hyrcaniae]